MHRDDKGKGKHRPIKKHKHNYEVHRVERANDLPRGYVYVWYKCVGSNGCGDTYRKKEVAP